MNTSKTRLSRADWTDAALGAMAETGTAGVNVEQLAVRLGATKGSFYHHFENRQALLDAALARWEDLIADDLGAANEITDPRERLFAAALAATGSELNGFVDLALGASIGDPNVAATVRRVNERRVAYLDALLQEIGVPAAVSLERAVGGVAAYLGLYQIQRATGERFDGDRLEALISHVVESMLTGVS